MSPSGKRYIGITSQKPERRWRNGAGYKSCRYFYHAIQKYGWDNFTHVIVASDLSEDEAQDMERSLIKKYRTNNADFGYNITPGGDCLNYISEDGRKRISASKSYPVVQLDKKLNILREYKSAKCASKETGIFPSQILGCCNKTVGYKTAGGYVWVYKADIAGLDRSEYLHSINHEKLPKRVCKLSKDMKFIEEFISIAEAAKSCGTHSSNISLAISGVAKSAAGFIWMTKEDYLDIQSGGTTIKRTPYINECYKPVLQFSLDMEFICEHPSRRAAANCIGVSPQAIGYACRSKTGISKGFVWKYKEVA